MRTYKTEGIILKRRNSGETDRILTIFTKQEGKIHIKATGVRKITSRRSSHIEPLNIALLNLYKGRGYPILTEVEMIEDFSDIKENLKKLGFAYHICELIDSLCPENQEHQSLYDLLKDTFYKLGCEDEVIRICKEFELSLLSLLGFYTASQFTEQFNSTVFIEQILEKKLKSRQIFRYFTP